MPTSVRHFSCGAVAKARSIAKQLRNFRRRARLRRAVSRLPPRQGQIFHLHCVELLSLSAISEQLCIPVPDVEAHLVDALVAIAADLPDESERRAHSQ